MIMLSSTIRIIFIKFISYVDWWKLCVVNNFLSTSNIPKEFHKRRASHLFNGKLYAGGEGKMDALNCVLKLKKKKVSLTGTF